MDKKKDNYNLILKQMVAVHPELTTDPSCMQGEVGLVVDDSEDSITVEFSGDIKAKYQHDALLTLKSQHTLLDYFGFALQYDQ